MFLESLMKSQQDKPYHQHLCRLLRLLLLVSLVEVASLVVLVNQLRLAVKPTMVPSREIPVQGVEAQARNCDTHDSSRRKTRRSPVYRKAICFVSTDQAQSVI